MRALPIDLEAIASGVISERRPAWRVFAYDLRSTTNTIRDIIANDVTLDPLIGPLELTDFVETIAMLETGSDFVSTGITAGNSTYTIVDPDGRFDPHSVIADSTALGRYFRDGNLIRIQEGDARVDSADWPFTATHEVVGQAGYKRSRGTSESRLTFKAWGREAHFLSFNRTSDDFPNGITYQAVAEQVAEEEMGLSLLDEVNFAGFGLSNIVEHNAVQMVDIDPMTMLATVMFVDGVVPRFDGEGILVGQNTIISNLSQRFYEDERQYLSIERPQGNVKPPNSVCVLGLDAELSIVEQERQILAEASVTTGYFTSGENFDVYWSEDHGTLAKNVAFRVLKSVAIGGLGGGENETNILSTAPQQEGIIGMRIRIDTGFAPWLLLFLTITYVTLAAIPDTIFGSGVGVITGFTISVGRLLQAAALAGALVVMSMIGRGQYEFVGDPFEYVFKEIRACARITGVGEFSLNEVEISNHWITNQTDGDNIAREILVRQQARGHPRTVQMLYDYALETDDVFEDNVTNRRFLINSIARTLTRNVGQQLATYQVSEITDNVNEST